MRSFGILTDSREIESKLIALRDNSKTAPTVYEYDYTDQNNHPVVISREMRQRYNRRALNGLPGESEAVKLLYKSTYQEAYDHALNYTEDIKSFQSEQGRALKSLYQTSFGVNVKCNEKALRNPGKEHAMTKLLYQPRNTEMTISDILAGDKRCRRDTAYNHDYRNFITMEKEKRLHVGSLRMPVPPPVTLATLKYEEWSKQQ
ncbi:hypothetical protein EDD86DRAFT_246954 [Gorgonomyces haynaldii]|nr:hypothetical protein EDD86DRAFT_246954 [Gorgonomyces haynaldii]